MKQIGVLEDLFQRADKGLTRELLEALPLPMQFRKGDAFAFPYIISDELLSATQVALLLRQPLLLTGEPGVGKTTFADALAKRLGLASALRNVVKSTMIGKDLLYTFDDVARFRDAAAGGSSRSKSPGYFRSRMGRRRDEHDEPFKPLVDYVQLSAFGLAIVRAAGRNTTIKPKLRLSEIAGLAFEDRDHITLGELFPKAFVDIDPSIDKDYSVVLIDEIDKAPRDAPNDLLDEVEQMRFGIQELGIDEITSDKKYWPIVVITSNSERNLPDAFLRRCVVHHLELSTKTLPEIILTRLAAGRTIRAEAPLVTELIEIFRQIRDDRDVERKPSTAELVSAALLLSDLGYQADVTPSKNPSWELTIPRLASIFAKKREDHPIILAKLRKTFG